MRANLAVVSLACLLLFGCVSAIVGLRLLMRARASRGVPELLMGMFCLVASGVGYPLVTMAPFVPNRALAVSLFVLGNASIVVGCSCLLFFTVTVFRSGAGWARWVAALGSVVFVVSGTVIVFSFVSSPTDGYLKARPAIAATNGVLTLAFAWTAFEGMRFYRMMRKRMTLGLAEPVVMNRFLLWTFSGGVSVTWTSVVTICLALGVDISTSSIAVSAISLGGAANAVLLVLIFMPPSAYTRWIERSSAAGAMATA